MRVEQLQQYAQHLADKGGLDVGALSSDTAKSLKAAGIDRVDLERIAGDDRVIRGDEFTALFELVEAKTDRGGGRPDLVRAQRVYESLSAELDRAQPQAVAPRAAARAGLRDEIYASGGAAKRPIQYEGAELPDINMNRGTPSKPNWFVRMMQCLFDWIPGVSTDGDRLRKYGRDLADQHASDIVGFREIYTRNVKAHGPFGPGGDPDVDFEGAMTAHLAERFQKEHGISEDAAFSRARTVVGAMSAQLEKKLGKLEKRVGDLPNLKETSSKYALGLARDYFSAKDTAVKRGGDWPARLDRAMKAPAANHPIMVQNAGKESLAANLIRDDNVKVVSYLMGMERSGGLANVPRDVVDGLLDAYLSRDIEMDAFVETLSELNELDVASRGELYGKIRAVPDANRGMVYATMGREHFSLRGDDATQRGGALLRTSRAAEALASRDPATVAEAKLAFSEERLGLERSDVKVGGTKIPVYFHPSISADRRAHYESLIAEAYGDLPQAVIPKLLAGEGGKATHIQVLPDGSTHSGHAAQIAPNGSLTSYILSSDNLVRLNTHALDHAEAEKGRAFAVEVVLHESAHLLDDLGDAAQDKGFFIGRDAEADPGGVLEGAWSHFSKQKERHEQIMEKFEDPKVHRWMELSAKGEHRTAKEDLQYQALDRELLARSGSVTAYGVHGGSKDGALRGSNLAEWWAETYAHFANPSLRGHLQQVDPVAHRAAARYHALLGAGTAPDVAIEKALRFSLATDVAAEQGKAMLKGGVTAAERADLNEIAKAFEEHGAALKGWAPFNADVKKMRGEEAVGAVAKGRELIAELDAAVNALPNGAEKQQLAAVRDRLKVAVDKLDAAKP